MKFRGILAIIFSLSLALFAGNALAGKSDKSGKSFKSDKQSSKHSGKSAKGPKSSKPGNGYGHCKSDKSGKGHAKSGKKGKGHERDDDCGGGTPVLTCTSDVVPVPNTRLSPEFIYGDGFLSVTLTDSINWVGQICDVEAELPELLETIIVPAPPPGPDPLISYLWESECVFEGGDPDLVRQESATEYWYPVDILLTCYPRGPN